MRGEIDRIAGELLESFEAGRQIDIVDDFAYPLPVMVICRLLGVPREDEPLFRAWSDALVAAADVRRPSHGRASPLQDPRDLRVHAGRAGAEPQAAGETLGWTAKVMSAFVDCLGVLIQGIGQGRVEQFGLARDVVVQGAGAHVRTLRDGPDAGACVAGLGQDLSRGADEWPSGLGATAFEAIPA